VSILNALVKPYGKLTREGEPSVEFRLLCSGELYNSKVVTADHRKCDSCRVLLTSPFELIVSS